MGLEGSRKDWLRDGTGIAARHIWLKHQAVHVDVKQFVSPVKMTT